MHLELIAPAPPSRVGKRRALYRCLCGAMPTLQVGNVRSGNTRSCGCQHHRTHGQYNTPLYKAWENMRQRAGNNGGIYPTYANVRCDPRWATFAGFLAHQPPGRPFTPGLCLSRFADQGDYSPENTRWLTRSENAKEQAHR